MSKKILRVVDVYRTATASKEFLMKINPDYCLDGRYHLDCFARACNDFRSNGELSKRPLEEEVIFDPEIAAELYHETLIKKVPIFHGLVYDAITRSTESLPPNILGKNYDRDGLLFINFGQEGDRFHEHPITDLNLDRCSQNKIIIAVERRSLDPDYEALLRAVDIKIIRFSARSKVLSSNPAKPTRAYATSIARFNWRYPPFLLGTNRKMWLEYDETMTIEYNLSGDFFVDVRGGVKDWMLKGYFRIQTKAIWDWKSSGDIIRTKDDAVHLSYPLFRAQNLPTLKQAERWVKLK